MGSVYKSAYTLAMPPNAVVDGQTVSWTTKRGGKRKSGKLTPNGRVLIETNKWIAKWKDENGVEHREATGCSSKPMAQIVLGDRVKEAMSIRVGVTSRKDVTMAEQLQRPISEHLDAFETSRKATDITHEQTSRVRKRVQEIFDFTKATCLSELTKKGVEEYIVFRKESNMAPKTLNHDITKLRTFLHWCIRNDLLQQDITRDIVKPSALISVNDRRAFTETELPVFFDAVKSRVDRSPERNYEREVLYRTMLYTVRNCTFSNDCNLRVMSVFSSLVYFLSESSRHPSIALRKDSKSL